MEIKQLEKKLENIGNVRQDYKHEPRIVVPRKTIIGDNLALKFYSMMKEREVRESDVCSAIKYLKNRIDMVKPYIGMGFAILSEDMLNVARWDNQYPIVLMNDIYTYGDGDIKTATLADIRTTGSFCIWELGIIGYERNSWKNFLSSKRTIEDKKSYLGDFLRQTELK